MAESNQDTLHAWKKKTQHVTVYWAPKAKRNQAVSEAVWGETAAVRLQKRLKDGHFHLAAIWYSNCENKHAHTQGSDRTAAPRSPPAAACYTNKEASTNTGQPLLSALKHTQAANRSRCVS